MRCSMARRSTFNDRVKEHLSRYETGAGGKGLWKGESYGHIIPETEHTLNILEPYRDDFWKYWRAQEGRVNLHMYFHHLNSSQALCFNLFAPFVFEKNGFGILQNMLGQGSGGADLKPHDWGFERIFDTEENTNFDFFFQPTVDAPMYFEIKYSEADFGTAKDDERHQQKLETIYRRKLAGKVDPKYLEGGTFFANYQILRNLSYLEPGGRMFFVVPRANESLTEGLRVIREAPNATYRESIHVLFLEDIVDRMLRVTVSDKMRRHFEQFKSKYIVA
jgi:hypothetical protein